MVFHIYYWTTEYQGLDSNLQTHQSPSGRLMEKSKEWLNDLLLNSDIDVEVPAAVNLIRVMLATLILSPILFISPWHICPHKPAERVESVMPLKKKNCWT